MGDRSRRRLPAGAGTVLAGSLAGCNGLGAGLSGPPGYLDSSVENRRGAEQSFALEVRLTRGVKPPTSREPRVTIDRTLTVDTDSRESHRELIPAYEEPHRYEIVADGLDADEDRLAFPDNVDVSSSAHATIDEDGFLSLHRTVA